MANVFEEEEVRGRNVRSSEPAIGGLLYAGRNNAIPCIQVQTVQTTCAYMESTASSLASTAIVRLLLADSRVVYN